MIEIRLAEADGRGTLEVRGHSGFARVGEDPVCAGVSALFWALPLGLRDVAGVPAEVETSVERLRVSWPAPLAPDAEAILATIVRALGEVAERYPAHVSVRGAPARLRAHA